MVSFDKQIKSELFPKIVGKFMGFIIQEKDFCACKWTCWHGSCETMRQNEGIISSFHPKGDTARPCDHVGALRSLPFRWELRKGLRNKLNGPHKAMTFALWELGSDASRKPGTEQAIPKSWLHHQSEWGQFLPLLDPRVRGQAESRSCLGPVYRVLLGKGPAFKGTSPAHGFSTLTHDDILGCVIPCSGGCPVYCMVFSSTPCLHPPGANSTMSLHPSCDNQKLSMSPDVAKHAPGGKTVPSWKALP